MAEGAVHGVDPEDVTFHEVGAVDSIVDVVGSCVALELLGAETVSCGPLPMGTGVVRVRPRPPARSRARDAGGLEGSRVRWTEEPHETTTPTGAALMAALPAGVSRTRPRRWCCARSATGQEGHAWSTPRTSCAPWSGSSKGSPAEELELLEANVDDAPGEILGRGGREAPRGRGARRLARAHSHETGRGAYKICALVRSGTRERLARLLMRETGALGVRHHRVGRTRRRTPHRRGRAAYGRCRVKVGSLDGEDFVAAPEYADAVRLARRDGPAAARGLLGRQVRLREVWGRTRIACGQ